MKVDAPLVRCREDKIGPPKATRIERVLGAAEAMFERNFTATTVERLSFESVGKLEELIVAEASPAARAAEGEAQKDSGAMRNRFRRQPGRCPALSTTAALIKASQLWISPFFMVPKGPSWWSLTTMVR